jgi:type VI secretion system protein ImpM
MSRAGTVGAYGKIGSQADFFRANAGEFSQAGLDRWFEQALETMRTEGGRLPEGPVAFLLAPRGAPHVFLGAFAPSTDAAGRSFPLVIFAEIASLAVAGALPSLPAAAGPFLSAASTLAMEGGALSASDLVERVRTTALPQLDDSPAPDDVESATVFAREPAAALVAALGGSPLALAYAFRTMGLACDQASKYGPDADAGVITVDAPAPLPIIQQMWLALVQRRLHWREGLPSLLWTEPPASDAADAAGRMLVTLGPPSSSVFGFLANPRHRSRRFWPLRTDVSVALDQALNALSPEQRRVVENPSVALGDLVTAFSA